MPRKRPLLKKLLLLTVASALCNGTHAAEIRGTVINENTQKFLELASVTVEGTTFQALTDTQGNFRITQLPPGTYDVTVSYTDLTSETRKITVEEAAPAVADFKLTSDIYLLGEFVVTSTVEGSADAVNKQRRAESARRVTSIDAFVDQTTGNPGEFLKNLEGVQMNYSQNEPQTISLRGFDASLTTVTMDGNPIASAASSSTNRVVQVDQLSIASIGSVEVFKAPIPSMSANSIGGAVNFITKSAFDAKGRSAFVQFGVNTDSHDFMSFDKTPGPGHGDSAERRIYPIGRFEYRDTLLNNRLGIVFSVARDHTNQVGSSTSHALNVTALPGGALPGAPAMYSDANATIRRGTFSMAPNRQLRTRDDISLNLDYKVTDKIAAFLRTSLSDYHSTNRNHGFSLDPNATTSNGTPNGTLSAGATLQDYTYTAGNNRMQATQSSSVFDKYTKSWQINPGLKFVSGDWRVDLVGGFSKSTNHYENADNFGSLSIGVNSTTANPVSWRIVTPRTDTEVPESVTMLAGPDVYSLNNYLPNQGNIGPVGTIRPGQGTPSPTGTGGDQRADHAGMVSSNFRTSQDVRYSGRLDIRRDFSGRFPFYIKGGLDYTEQYRDKKQPQKRWYWMGDDGIAGTADDTTAAGAQLGRFKEATPVTTGLSDVRLREPEYFDSQALYSYWRANPQVLQENLAYAEQQKFAGRQKVHETITAAYLMANVKFDKLNVLAGVRVEKTEDEAISYRVLPVYNPAFDTDNNPLTNNSADAVVLPPGVNANSLAGIRATHRWATSKNDYTSDPFKYLHLKYELLDGLQARGSYTEAIGRPDFGSIVPTMTQSDTDIILDGVTYDGRIQANGADLGPQTSKGLDVSLEYYTKSSGSFTVSAYSRKVKDYISTTDEKITSAQLTELNLGPEYSNYLLRRTRNIGEADWSGVEVGIRQQSRGIKFLPKYLHGFEVQMNYTKNVKVEGNFGALGSNITTLQNVIKDMYNASLSYRTPRGKFFAMVSTNYQSDRPTDSLPAFNANGQRDRKQDPYQFWNLDMSYKLNDRIRFTCTGRNIFSERPTVSQIGGIVINQQQDTGIAWTIATRIDL